MKHDYVDRYSRLESPVHSLDARAKTIALIGLVVICVTTPPGEWWAFCIYAAVVAIIANASRVPARYLLTRILVVIPFILVVAIFVPFMHRGGGTVDLGLFHVSRGGLVILWNVTVKSIIAVSCLILLASTTQFSDLMHGLEKLHVPRFFTLVSSFMYRYLFIIIDEEERMSRARDSRNFRGRWIWQAKIIGHMIASLFLRSQERSERVYKAMCARGFEGTFPRWTETTMQANDYVFLTLVLLAGLAGRLVTVWKS